MPVKLYKEQPIKVERMNPLEKENLLLVKKWLASEISLKEKNRHNQINQQNLSNLHTLTFLDKRKRNPSQLKVWLILIRKQNSTQFLEAKTKISWQFRQKKILCTNLKQEKPNRFMNNSFRQCHTTWETTLLKLSRGLETRCSPYLRLKT